MWVAKITGDGPEDYTDGYNKSGKELFLQFGTGTGSHYTQPSVNDVYNVIVKIVLFLIYCIHLYNLQTTQQLRLIMWHLTLVKYH